MICRSSELGTIDYPLPLRLIRSLVLMVLPIPREWLERRTVRCGICGHEWRLTTREWQAAIRSSGTDRQ